MSFAKILSGLNVFEISNLQEQETESRYPGDRDVTLLGVNIDKRLSMIRLQSRAHERLLPCPTGGSDNDGQWGLGSGLRGWA
jgi:hypothetical protein